MKKMILISVLFAYAILSTLSTFAATHVEDALTIDSETRTLISATEEDTVIRVYNGYFLYGFSQRKSLEETLNDGWSLSLTSYIIASKGENGEVYFSHKAIRDDAIYEPTTQSQANSLELLYNNNLAFYELIDDNARILSALGPFVTAQKTVYMHGLPNDGMYIYYETNIGDYVYYKRYLEAEEEYLVPLETFCEYAAVVQEHKSESAGGYRADTDLYDLSSYNLSNYALTPRKIAFMAAGCGGAALLIGFGIAWFVVYKKKKI